MKKESLEVVRLSLLNIIDKADIDQVDKTELIINLFHFLDPNSYLDNINLLKKGSDINAFQVRSTKKMGLHKRRN